MRKIAVSLILLMAVVMPARSQEHRLVILHTNDTHSHIDPIRGGYAGGRGGVIERAAYIDSVRCAEGRRNVLLLDAGDISQGTSYFSILGGDIEVAAVNAMKYDAMCLGNHEFDNGTADLARRMKDFKGFALCANYEFSDKKLSRVVKPYAIIHRAGLKIGIIGILTDVRSVVDGHIAKNLEYLDPVSTSNRLADFLKNEKHCDLVVLLTHLGYEDTGFTDQMLVASSRNVDIVIGGHSHSFLEQACGIPDMDGHEVTVVTDGCWGQYVGRLVIEK